MYEIRIVIYSIKSYILVLYTYAHLYLQWNLVCTQYALNICGMLIFKIYISTSPASSAKWSEKKSHPFFFLIYSHSTASKIGTYRKSGYSLKICISFTDFAHILTQIDSHPSMSGSKVNSIRRNPFHFYKSPPIPHAMQAYKTLFQAKLSIEQKFLCLVHVMGKWALGS